MRLTLSPGEVLSEQRPDLHTGASGHGDTGIRDGLFGLASFAPTLSAQRNPSAHGTLTDAATSVAGSEGTEVTDGQRHAVPLSSWLRLFRTVAPVTPVCPRVRGVRCPGQGLGTVRQEIYV